MNKPEEKTLGILCFQSVDEYVWLRALARDEGVPRENLKISFIAVVIRQEVIKAVRGRKETEPRYTLFNDYVEDSVLAEWAFNTMNEVGWDLAGQT
jgi:hypothetical protein